MRSLFFVLLTLTLHAPLNAQDAAALDEIRVAMAAGQYQDAVKTIDKHLTSQTRDPAQRYQLLMLKGESRLQLKDRMGALSAFNSAAKVAPELKDLAAARANAVVIERSTQGRYVPKPGSGGGEPIDIMNVDSRKQAMIALQGELSAQYKPQIDAALRATQLPAIEQVFSRVADIYFLELYATGEGTQGFEVMQKLGAHTFNLMHTEVQRSAQRIDFLTQRANSSGSTARGWDTGRMGLTSPERDEVKQIMDYLAKIRQRASEYRGVAAKLGGDADRWNALVADTVTASTDAESLYNDR